MASNDQAILEEWGKQRDNKDGDEWRYGDSAIRLIVVFARCIVVWPSPPMPPPPMPPRQGWGDGLVEGAWLSLTGWRVGQEERKDLWTLSWARSMGCGGRRRRGTRWWSVMTSILHPQDKEAGHQKDGGSPNYSKDEKEGWACAHCTRGAQAHLREYHQRYV